MGLDEHYIDITKLVEDRASKLSEDELMKVHMIGPFYPNEEAFTECSCGCEQRLKIGSEIAKEIRDQILQDLKLTCSVGIAHNKLLAKLVGQLNKPDNQTTLAPMKAAVFMSDLKDLRCIHGIGGKTANRIEELGIETISNLQTCEMEKLLKAFGVDMATRLKEMAMGVDTGEVKPSGKPKTVGLEDSCRPFSVRSEAVEMFQSLLPRLVYQIRNDKRLPLSLRVTVRQFDILKKVSFKETKQVSLVPSQFKFIDGELILASGADEKIIKCVMIAFDHIIGSKEKFFVNLVGLCFTKFQDQKSGAGAITSFLAHKNDDSSRAEQLLNSSTEDDAPSPKRQKLQNASCSSNSPQLPSNIDAAVWKELPIDVQRELLRSWNSSSNNDLVSTSNIAQTKKKETSNTIMNHFKRNQS